MLLVKKWSTIFTHPNVNETKYAWSINKFKPFHWFIASRTSPIYQRQASYSTQNHPLTKDQSLRASGSLSACRTQCTRCTWKVALYREHSSSCLRLSFDPFCTHIRGEGERWGETGKGWRFGVATRSHRSCFVWLGRLLIYWCSSPAERTCLFLVFLLFLSPSGISSILVPMQG